MRIYYADLHIHLGRGGSCRVIKVAASRDMTLANILEESFRRKGLDMVGVVDMATTGGLEELLSLMERGEVAPVDGGGFSYHGRLTLIPGAEVELEAPRGAKPGRSAHFIAYVPDFGALRELAAMVAHRVKNPCLSTQRLRFTPGEFIPIISGLGGFVCPAHAFTPHRGVYGCMTGRLRDVIPLDVLEEVWAVELGLSADTDMADMVSELHRFTFLTNSDAHSLSRIGREHNELELESPTFKELCLALKRVGGRRVRANYGLDPRLGKYHRTRCTACGYLADAGPVAASCPLCGSTRITPGVWDRLLGIADLPAGVHPPERAPYRYQVPLEFIPGLGPKGVDRLLGAFGSEMAVLHQADEESLARVAGERVASLIVASREGRLRLQAGGGGTYGRVMDAMCDGHN